MAKRKKQLAVLEPVEKLILQIRGEPVILDSELARIYGVPTKRLNEQVRRNAERFPPDFVFLLTPEEVDFMRSQSATGFIRATTMRSQIATASKRNVRFLPYAFTEHGAIMAANVLRSRRAVEMSIHVIRAFVALRREAGRYETLGRMLAELERTQKLQGRDIQVLFDAFRKLEETTSWAYPEGRRLIGFRVEPDAKVKARTATKK
ncbi:MAG: ORF6N domain-containing protein [Verrucomicrobia bacterium]|nr:ORF6N domain-containing protein [Verrucomicrobiota bacterium]